MTFTPFLINRLTMAGENGARRSLITELFAQAITVAALVLTTPIDPRDESQSHGSSVVGKVIARIN
jgi:hypothetical protein